MASWMSCQMSQQAHEHTRGCKCKNKLIRFWQAFSRKCEIHWPHPIHTFVPLDRTASSAFCSCTMFRFSCILLNEIWERLYLRMQSIHMNIKWSRCTATDLPTDQRAFDFILDCHCSVRSGSSNGTHENVQQAFSNENNLFIMISTCAMCVFFFFPFRKVYLYLERDCNLIRHSNALSSFILKYFVASNAFAQRRRQPTHSHVKLHHYHIAESSNRYLRVI